MSSAWKQYRKGYKTPPSHSAGAFKLPDEDAVRAVTDTFVVNDLKEEYYYSQNDIFTDAVNKHIEIADKNPDLYKTLIGTLRKVMLDCQKTLAAIYLYDRNIDRNLSLELLKDVRPTWKMTFFYMLKKPATVMGLRRKGWGRSVRTLAKKVLLEKMSPFHASKYHGKLFNIARWAHVKPSTASIQYLFRKTRKEAIEADPYFTDIKTIRETKGKDAKLLFDTLWKTHLPFTVLKGLLGDEVNSPNIFKAIIHTMTVWETILSLRQVESRGLLDDREVQDQLMEKLKPEVLQKQRIDVVELLQAYRKLTHPFAKEALNLVISSQISAMTETLMPYLQDKRVAVVFDTSGSMENCLDWSLALSLACSMANKKNTVLIAFADSAATLPVPTEKNILLETYRNAIPSGGTSLGAGLMEALKHTPDIIIFISDFEGNMEPWSDQVYKDYVAANKKFPETVAIKFTTSPDTAYGEYTALRTQRWLGIPNEHRIVIRNLWDLPTLLEYIFNLIPILAKRKSEIIQYVT